MPFRKDSRSHLPTAPLFIACGGGNAEQPGSDQHAAMFRRELWHARRAGYRCGCRALCPANADICLKHVSGRRGQRRDREA